MRSTGTPARGEADVANKIDTAVDNIETALGALVVAKTLKAVSRAVLNPFGQVNVPVLGLAISRLGRENVTWTAELVLMLVANKGNVAADETLTELVAAVDGCITTLVDSGSAGASIDRPVWDTWYAGHNVNEPLQQVGALATLRIRVEDPLVTV